MSLLNPANDAKAMTDVIKRSGFTEVKLRDGNKAQMSAVIARVSNPFGDTLTNLSGGKYLSRMTFTECNIVNIDGGRSIQTVLGRTMKNRRGTFDPLLGGDPVKLQFGKKWSVCFSNAFADGNTYQLQTETKIVAVETGTISAGTFQTFVVRTTMFSSSGVAFT